MAVIDVLPVVASTPPETVPNNGVYLPIVTRACPEVRDLRTPSVFGVQMYGNTGTTSKLFQDLVESNASWVRVEVSWQAIEPKNVATDQFNWEKADRALAASAQGGINIIGTINHNPAWAAESSAGPINPENLDDFGQFVNAVVERYDGDGFHDDPCGRVVKHWEFYNEPDGNDGRWGHDGDQYANMLSVAYPSVKFADREAQVLLGGIAYDWFEDEGGPFVKDFLPSVLAANGGFYFDVMNFHAYPAFAPNWAEKGPGIVEKSAAIRAVLASHGFNKPLMITESGAHSNNDPGTPGTPISQASYVVELFTQSKAADIDVMIWFMLTDPWAAYPFKNGLVTDNDIPLRKPAFYTYQQSVEHLASAEFDRELTGGELDDPKMLAYRFTKPDTGAALYVAWMNPVDTGSIAPLVVNGAQAIVYDILTNSYTVHDNDDGKVDGAVTISVGNRPLLIEIQP